ncbi:kinase-like domain-containing protein [Scenedesmus sp. NREL 46B-D3]|nr:kinase-like domain-containing protein [Scenedesmus sp. NREL 46B-D3]
MAHTCTAALSIAIVQLRSLLRNFCAGLLHIACAATTASVQARLVVQGAVAAPPATEEPVVPDASSSSSTNSHNSDDSAWEGSAAHATEVKQSTSDANVQESDHGDPCCQQQQQQPPYCSRSTVQEPASSAPAAPLVYVATSGCSLPSDSPCGARRERSSFDARSALASFDACSALGSFDMRSARGSIDGRSARAGSATRNSFDLTGVKSMDACSTCSIDCSSAAVNALVGPGWTRVLSFSNSSSNSGIDGPLNAAAPGAAQQQGEEQSVKLGVLIGAGSFGKVYRARWRRQHVAVKVLHLLGSKAAAKAMAEAAVMIRARHANVVAAHHVTMWQRAQQCDAAADCLVGGPGSSSGQGCMQLPDTLGRDTTANSTGRSSSSDAAASSSSASFNATPASTVGVSSSSCGVSTSIIEGGWGEDELRELGQGDAEDGVETQAWIVLELCDGTLDTAARSGQLGSLESQLSSLLDVAQGMAYLHDSSIVHGDLKAANVCYVAAAPGCSRGERPSDSCSRLTCKVTDFSMTRVLDAGKTHASTTSLGTITHLAPEVLLSGQQTKAGDVYSYGLLIWEVLHGRPPYSECHHEVEIMERVLLKQRRPTWDAHTREASPELVSLAEQCWSSDASRRPSFGCICATLQQLLQQAGAAAGLGGARLCRNVHVDLGQLATNDPAAGWLLGLGQQEAAAGDHQGGVEGQEQSEEKQAQQHVYASAGPASGPCSGYW